MTSDNFRLTIDVRDIAPRERHPLIFSSFEGLPAGEAIQLVNDHDPRPLYHHFQAEHAGRFTWQVLESGPDTWRVRIGKTSADCCGHCSCG